MGLFEDFFQNIFNFVPEYQKLLFSLFLYTILILTYAVFIWKFYRFLANRDIIQLNLRQYNYSKHPVLEKFLAVILYTLEYLIILPFLVIFWFAILSIFLLILSESKDTQQILLISAAIIASTRITAYINEELSKDIAKIFPFTVLVVFLLGFNMLDRIRIIERFFQIPGLFNSILIFLIFIFVIEFVLRGLYSITDLFKSNERESEKEK